MANHRSNARRDTRQHHENSPGYRSSGEDNNHGRHRAYGGQDETAPGRGAGGCYQGAGPYGWEEDDASPDPYRNRGRAQDSGYGPRDDEVYNDRLGFDHPARHAQARDTQRRDDYPSAHGDTLRSQGRDIRRQEQAIDLSYHGGLLYGPADRSRNPASPYAGSSRAGYQGASAQNNAWQLDDGRVQMRSQGGSQRGRGPSNYTRSDVRIAEDINERLTDDEVLDASDISVSVHEGVVTLSGAVASRWMRHLAEDIADACSGVKDIHNEITVATNAGQRKTENADAGIPAGKDTDD